MRTVVVRFVEESFRAVTVRSRGKVVLDWSEGPSDFSDLSRARTVVLWDAPAIHFMREQVFRGPGEVLALQIQEKVERTGFFRSPPSVFYHVEREEGNTAQVVIAAVERTHLDVRLESLWRHGACVQAVVHPALAVAFLAAQSFPERTLTVWVEEQGFYLTVTEGGHILSLRFVAFDNLTGPVESLVREETAFTRDQYDRAGGPGISRVLACGPLRRLLDPSEALWASRDMSDAVQKAAMEHPEWFGALCVPAAFNMLPERVQAWNRHMPWAMRAAAALLVLSLGQAGLWGYWKHQARALENQARAVGTQVAYRADVAQKAIPWNRMAVLQEYRRVSETFEREPRMDAWMVWLSEVMPKNFRVVRCALSKGGEGARVGGAVSTRPIRRAERPAETAQAPVLSLEVKGNAGIAEAHRAFGALLAVLKERKSEVFSRFDYDEKSSQAVFSFEMRL
ncbi:MAG: hypothetical protein ACUVSA_05260 [Desulfosoma sp.]|uniref:hypothetical protein n=1 Tax=Desulfosoma sp. TaxID=2603217 RepID=UPI004049A268